MSLFVAVWLPVAVAGLLYPLQRNGFRSSGRQLQELVLPFAKGKRPRATGRMMSPATLWRGGPGAGWRENHPSPMRIGGGYTPAPPIARAHPRPP